MVVVDTECRAIVEVTEGTKRQLACNVFIMFWPMAVCSLVFITSRGHVTVVPAAPANLDYIMKVSPYDNRLIAKQLRHVHVGSRTPRKF